MFVLAGHKHSLVPATYSNQSFVGYYFNVTSVYKVFECFQDRSYVCATCGHSESWEMVYCLLQFSKSVVNCLWLDPCMGSSGLSTGVHKQLCWVTFLSSVIFLVLLFPFFGPLAIKLGVYLPCFAMYFPEMHSWLEPRAWKTEREKSFTPTLLDHISSQWRSFLPHLQNFTWLHVPAPPLPIMPEDPFPTLQI